MTTRSSASWPDGCSPTVASLWSAKPAAAMAAAARLEPSALLVDVELPDGDGIALAHQLAALPWRPRVVLTSIDGDITSTEAAHNAGARAFLNKAVLANAPLARLLGEE